MKEVNKQLNLSINFTEKSLQDKLIDKTENESLCNLFIKFLDETENESFF